MFGLFICLFVCLFVFIASDLFVLRKKLQIENGQKQRIMKTAIIDCTEEGRQGLMKRKCNGRKWGEEISLCVKAVLNSVALQAKVCKSRICD